MPRKEPPDNVVPFRRREKAKAWTRASDYGVSEAAPRRRRIPAGLRRWGPLLLLVLAVTVYVLLRDGYLGF